ncbi:hypothetical protein HMI54_010211 [Coelomomyces lativittatus]|nr:hypothetical protein HMI54_010211 [Coelomomyces lativittatus]
MHQYNPFSKDHESISSSSTVMPTEMDDEKDLDYLISSMTEGNYIPSTEENHFYSQETNEFPAPLELTHADKMAIAPFEFQGNEKKPTNLPFSEKDPIQTWDVLMQEILPIFIGKSIFLNIEHYNRMVKVCLEHHLYETVFNSLEQLLQEGMRLIVLQFYGTNAWNVKLDANLGLDSNIFLQFTEIWSSFWGSTLPQIEAVFVPLEKIIKQAHLMGSVRQLALRTFREKVVFSQIDAVKLLAHKISKSLEKNNVPSSDCRIHHVSLLLQMLLVLSDLKDVENDKIMPRGDDRDEFTLEKLITARNELSIAVVTYRKI